MVEYEIITSSSNGCAYDWWGASSALVASIAKRRSPGKFDGCLGWTGIGCAFDWFWSCGRGPSIERGLALLLAFSCPALLSDCEFLLKINIIIIIFYC